MKEISKAALVGGAAAAVVAATVGMASPAQAYGSAHIETIVTWTGGDSILVVDYPGEGIVMEDVGYHQRIVHHDFSAYSGDRIGVDPIMGDADYISCTLYINGRVAWHHAAVAGDGADANCIRRLNARASSSRA